MVKGLYTAYTGMINEQKRLDVLSNNLANADTNGYKKEGTTSQTFADELAIKIKDTSSYGLAQKLGTISMGVHIGETYTDYSTGSFKNGEVLFRSVASFIRSGRVRTLVSSFPPFKLCVASPVLTS